MSLMYGALYHSVAPLAGLFSQHPLPATLAKLTRVHVVIIFMIFIVDNAGRRKPLLWGTPALAMLFIIFTIISSQMRTPGGEVNKSASSAGVGIMFLFNIIFNLSWGPMSWTYLEVIV